MSTAAPDGKCCDDARAQASLRSLQSKTAPARRRGECGGCVGRTRGGRLPCGHCHGSDQHGIHAEHDEPQRPWAFAHGTQARYLADAGRCPACIAGRAWYGMPSLYEAVVALSRSIVGCIDLSSLLEGLAWGISENHSPSALQSTTYRAVH
jgi:hypothetical protein